MNVRPPALVLLAAGASSRLGSPKALAPLPGGTPLARLLAAGRALGDDTTAPLVVAGPDYAAIAAAAPAGVEVAHHADWAAGRTGTVRVARELRPGRDLCIAPVDVPLVPFEVFASLAEAWAAAGSPERGWLAPRYHDRHGHPVVVGRALLGELDRLEPGEPLRRLRERASALLEAEVDAPEVLDDLDSPADLAALIARLQA